MKVAILGGPASQTKQLESWLVNGGHQPEFFRTGHSFFSALRRHGFDLLVIEVTAAEPGTIDLIRSVRHHFEWHIPVVAIMARDAWHLAADALKAGADDYLVRPLRETEIQSRINTAAMRHVPDIGDTLEIGAYLIDTKSTKIILNGESVNLTRKEFELAAYFFHHSGQLISHDMLLSRIWKLQSDIDTRTVATHVSRIRKKLGLDGTHGCEIVSLYGYGYRCLIDLPAEAAEAPGHAAIAEPASSSAVAAIRAPAAEAIELGGAMPLPAALAASVRVCAPEATHGALAPDGTRTVDRYVANLLREREDFEDQIRRLRDAFCEATLELRALKRQGARRHPVETTVDYSEDLA